MGKNRDIILILSLVIIGMFIPFFGSITINYGFKDFLKIASTFGYFLLIFIFELGFVYLYFTFSTWTSNKKKDNYKPK